MPPFSLASLLAGLPSQCAICRTWQAQALCADCRHRFARPVPRCLTCGLRLEGGALRCGTCLRDPPPLDACICAVDYAYPWSACIVRLKFQGQAGSAAALADLMRDAAGAREALQAADLVMPMPLAPRRLRERGFNQAHELARRLAPQRTHPGVLLRTRETPPQLARGAAERSRNVRGAFAPAAAHAAALRGKSLLLVDDVMTSGASLYAAASALRDAGAAHVSALVLARTPAPGQALAP